MIPKAYITHQIPERVRIRIPSERKRAAFFAHAEKVLLRHKGIESIEAQPLTGSLLIRHRGELEELGDYARRRGLFEIQRPGKREPWTEKLRTKMDRWDDGLRRATEDQWDISSAMAVGLFGAGIYQAFRRKLLPPALTLVSQALTLVSSGREGEVEAKAKAMRRASAAG